MFLQCPLPVLYHIVAHMGILSHAGGELHGGIEDVVIGQQIQFGRKIAKGEIVQSLETSCCRDISIQTARVSY